MIKTMKKRHWKRGETLVEILVAVLIVALSAALFATFYSASMNIDVSAQKQDKEFYEAVEELEKMIEKAEGGDDVTVHYKPTNRDDVGDKCDVDVEFFTKDGMSVYGDTTAAGSGSGGDTSSGGGTSSGGAGT